MSKEKQIEETIKIVDEMASLVCRYHDLHCNGHSCVTCWRRTTNCDKYPILYRLAESNYRKQSEGEWKRSEKGKYDYFCTICGEKAVQNIYGNYDRLFKFCPNCGAKMKGGAEQ